MNSFNQTVEYSVIVAYLVMMVAIGLVFRRFNVSVADYFRSGSQGTWWLVGTSSFMGSLSAVTFTGYGGAAFEAGWSILAVYLGNVVGMLIQAFVLAPMFRQLRATTFPEIMRERFGTGTQQFYAYSKLVMFTLQASLWLFGLGAYTSATFGLPVAVVIPVLGVVALSYPMLGGKWAVMAADFVKGLILMTVTIFLSIYCLAKVGGISGLFAAIKSHGLEEQFAFFKPEGQFSDHRYTWQWALAVFSISVVSNCALANAMKFFAVKDGREARKAAGLSAVLMLIGTIFWFIPPITARLLFEQEVLQSGLTKPAEASMAIIALKLLPAGMLGMMVVAMFSATMSAMDVGINGNAAIVIKDVLPSVMRLLRRPLPSDAVQIRYGKIATIMFGGLIIGFAHYFSRQRGVGILDLMLNLGSILGLPLAVPTVLSLFMRRVPPWSALVSFLAAAIPPLLAWMQPEQWAFHERTLWSLVLGAVAFALTTLMWKTTSSEYRERVDRLFARMHRPVDFAAEVGAGSDRRQLLLIGRLSWCVAAFVFVLLAIPNPLSGRISILLLSTVIAFIGWLLIRAGRREA